MRASRRLFQALAIATLGITTKFFVTTYYVLGYGKVLTYNDATCKLHGTPEMLGSEDLAIGKDGVLFVTSGDLHNVFDHGSRAAKPGGLWVLNFNANANQLHQLQLEGFDQELHGFHAHGIFISNITDRLYVVNHAHEYSGIEIFHIEYAASSSGKFPVLQHEGTIGGDGRTFLRGSLNDVVEGGNEISEVYITQWLPNAIPLKGKKATQKTMSETIGLLGNVAAQLFRIKQTMLYRCARSQHEGWECLPATTIKFVSANGITISSDRSRVFVNDPPLHTISMFDRREDGTLKYMSSFDTVDVMDNIEYQQDGDDSDYSIIMGSIDKPHQYSIDKDILGKQNVPVSGGAVVAHYSKVEDQWRMERLVTHDGRLLSQISAAARWGSTLVMGSPFSTGLLVCIIA